MRNYPDINGYDVIILGYPNWWNTIPTLVFNFLEHYDWRGKRIIPIVTSGGSGLGRSVDDIRKICVGAEDTDGGAFLGHEVEDSKQEISTWARKALN